MLEYRSLVLLQDNPKVYVPPSVNTQDETCPARSNPHVTSGPVKHCVFECDQPESMDMSKRCHSCHHLKLLMGNKANHLKSVMGCDC